MSEDLLNCPFCNAKAMFIADSKELVACSNITCHMNHVVIRKTVWNTRSTPTPEVGEWEKRLREVLKKGHRNYIKGDLRGEKMRILAICPSYGRPHRQGK